MADSKKVKAARAAIDKKLPVERFGLGSSDPARYTAGLDEFIRDELARLSAEVDELKGAAR